MNCYLFRLLSVASSAFSRSTIQKLIELQDNYDPDTDNRETYSAEESQEIDSFIDAIFETPIMQLAQEFLASKNLPNGRDSFYEMWFELYSRGNGVISSCGFEHVFVGELHPDEVSGFHNWEQFAVQEDNRELNYMGYMDFVDLGSVNYYWIVSTNYFERPSNQVIVLVISEWSYY